LTSDPAFLASLRILDGIGSDASTRDCAIAFLTSVASDSDPIQAINAANDNALFCTP